MKFRLYYFLLTKNLLTQLLLAVAVQVICYKIFGISTAQCAAYYPMIDNADHDPFYPIVEDWHPNMVYWTNDNPWRTNLPEYRPSFTEKEKTQEVPLVFTDWSYSIKKQAEVAEIVKRNSFYKLEHYDAMYSIMHSLPMHNPLVAVTDNLDPIAEAASMVEKVNAIKPMMAKAFMNEVMRVLGPVEHSPIFSPETKPMEPNSYADRILMQLFEQYCLHPELQVKLSHFMATYQLYIVHAADGLRTEDVITKINEIPHTNYNALLHDVRAKLKAYEQAYNNNRV